MISENDIFEVILSYSDLSHEDVMHKASLVLAHGADFRLLGTKNTMLPAKVPVISICAVRTGCGKSQTTRKVCEVLESAGKKVAVVRHPMPYGDLAKQAVQRFATPEDLDKHECTIEEREEYEPHIDKGRIVYAGVDYGAILEQAEAEADIVIWDGGNNDLPFYKPDLNILVADPHRPGHELSYYPGEVNFRQADVIVINKVVTADRSGIMQVRENIRKINPSAVVIDAASPVTVDDPSVIMGKRVLVIEDGPTLTHGEMKFGAGVVAAERCGAAEFVDPRPFLVGELQDTFKKYPGIGTILPAMGYGDQQVKDLEETINAADADVVVEGTPIDLKRIITVNKPIANIRYELQEVEPGVIEEMVAKAIDKA